MRTRYSSHSRTRLDVCTLVLRYIKKIPRKDGRDVFDAGGDIVEFSDIAPPEAVARRVAAGAFYNVLSEFLWRPPLSINPQETKSIELSYPIASACNEELDWRSADGLIRRDSGHYRSRLRPDTVTSAFERLDAISIVRRCTFPQYYATVNTVMWRCGLSFEYCSRWTKTCKISRVLSRLATDRPWSRFQSRPNSLRHFPRAPCCAELNSAGSASHHPFTIAVCRKNQSPRTHPNLVTSSSVGRNL